MFRRISLAGFVCALFLVTMSDASAGIFRRFRGQSAEAPPCCPASAETTPATTGSSEGGEQDAQKIHAAVVALLEAQLPEKEHSQAGQLLANGYFDNLADAEQFVAKSEPERTAIYSKELANPTAAELATIAKLLETGKIDIAGAFQLKAHTATKRADLIKQLEKAAQKPDELTKEEQVALFKAITKEDFKSKSGLTAEAAFELYAATPKAKRKPLLELWEK